MGKGLKRARRAAKESGKAPSRDMILAAGVRNLKEYGYPSVTTENILTDNVYKAFFRGMLTDNLGKGSDDLINSLLAEIDA